MPKKTKNPTALDVVQHSALQSHYHTFTGKKLLDRNFPGNFLLVESASKIYSFNSDDILDEEETSEGFVRITMRPGCSGMMTTPYIVDHYTVSLIDGIDNREPPLPIHKLGDPPLATESDITELVASRPLAKTLSDAASKYKNECELGATLPNQNHCTHYLSSAFIRAGYNELLRKNSEGRGIFHHWCDTITPPRTKNENARPIKAKEMHEWFKSMKKSSQTERPDNQGFWAVYQHDEEAYPGGGGHVLIYDSDKKIAFGTGVYWRWKEQYFYQW
ncbi:hypothetical protein [Paracnuella aquatica]|uniref:hypothetical protein n=1 Tax=Paracnuella aquatica TaxID=2268757 RepID=UPI000DEFB9B9|nr:hypothetical protein [Paracnuella aquatica]RPD46485.1 hypothetical protein DRJ53_13675 [Paracnuella aquatica]